VCEHYGFLFPIGYKEDDPNALEQIAKGNHAYKLFPVLSLENNDRIVAVQTLHPSSKSLDRSIDLYLARWNEILQPRLNSHSRIFRGA